MTRNTIILGILVLALIVAGGFAFYQSQNLAALEATSTEVVANLRSTGTVAAESAIGTSTQAADNAIATGTTLADSAIATGTALAASNFATSTQAAGEFAEAAATSTQSALINNANSRRAVATSTSAANSAFATGTHLADSNFATSTQAAENAATQAAISSQTARDAHAAATEAQNVKTTLESQNLALSSTLEASGWVGEGLFGDSIVLPEGFKFFQEDGYEIALPESFEGADLRANPRPFFVLLDSLGYEATTDYLREQDENFLFFGFEHNDSDAVPRATISIIRDVPSIQSSLGDYLGGAYLGLQGSSAVIVSEIVPVNGQAAGRGILEQQFANGAVRQVQYIFKVDEAFYLLTYTLPVNEFEAMRSVIEQSAASFRLRD